MAAATRRILKSRWPVLAVVSLVGAVMLIVVMHRPDEHKPAFPHGEIRVAVDASSIPFAYYIDADGLVGIDIDIGRAIGDHLGLPVRFTNIGIDALYDSLINDQADIIISSLIFDSLRDVRFTHPYFDAGLVLVSADPLDGMTALPGRSVAFEFGSSADSEIRAWSRRIDAFESQPYELPDYALDAARIGVADTALVDRVSAGLYLNDHPEWTPHLTQITHAHFVTAVRSDHKNTYLAADEAIRDLLQDGTIDQIVSRWLRIDSGIKLNE